MDKEYTDYYGLYGHLSYVHEWMNQCGLFNNALAWTGHHMGGWSKPSSAGLNTYEAKYPSHKSTKDN